MKKYKYCIEKLVSEIEDNIAEKMESILTDDPFGFARLAEDSELIDDKDDALAEFEGLVSTIEVDENGKYIVTRYLLMCGEPEIDEDISEDQGEDVYVLNGGYIDKFAPFDEDACAILKELGVHVKEE